MKLNHLLDLLAATRDALPTSPAHCPPQPVLSAFHQHPLEICTHPHRVAVWQRSGNYTDPSLSLSPGLPAPSPIARFPSGTPRSGPAGSGRRRAVPAPPRDCHSPPNHVCSCAPVQCTLTPYPKRQPSSKAGLAHSSPSPGHVHPPAPLQLKDSTLLRR